MATTTQGVNTASTSNASTYASGSFTPAASDLLVAFVVASGTVDAAPTMTDSQSLGFSLFKHTVYSSSANSIYCFVANKLAANSAMTVTFNCPNDAATGCIIEVFRVSGMSRTAFSGAVRQVAEQRNQAATGTPAVTFGSACLTGNVTLGCVGNSTSPAGLTPPSSWTETPTPDVGYSTPTTGQETVNRDSGFTGTTITWGGTSASVFGTLAVELDTSAAPSMVVKQAATSGRGNSGGAGVTLAGTTAGNCLVLIVADSSTISAPSGWVDSGQGSVGANTNAFFVACFVKANIAGGSITAIAGGASSATSHMFEISGAATSSPVDVGTKAANQTGGAAGDNNITIGPMTTNFADVVFIAQVDLTGAATPGDNTDWAMPVPTDGVASSFTIQGAAGAITGKMTDLTGSDPYGIIMIGITSPGGNNSVAASGSSITATAGTVSITGDANVAATGSSMTITAGTIGKANTVAATGSSITATTGTVSVSGGATKAVTGSSLTITAGTVSESGSANVSATGSAITATAGTVAVSTATNVTVNAVGSSITATAGTVSLSGGASKAATGSAITATAGTVSVSGGASKAVTGSSLSITAGTVSVTTGANVTVNAVGSSMSLSIGPIGIAADANVSLTGVSMLLSASSVSVKTGTGTSFVSWIQEDDA